MTSPLRALRPLRRVLAGLLALPVGLTLGGARAASAAEVSVAPDVLVEVVVTGIPRPLQVGFGPAGALVVLSQGRGDAAGEIVTVDPSAAIPIEGGLLPRRLVPFAEDERKTVLGSLAINPRTEDIVLGEENGNRIYRLTEEGSLAPLAVGLYHLVGGSGIAFDGDGRLVVIDFVSTETQLRSESRPPPALDWLAGEGYQGPLVYRLDLGEDRPLPRRLDLGAPFFPRGRQPANSLPSPRFVAVATTLSGDIVLLDSLGQVTRLTADGRLHLVAALGAGHYHRTNMAVAPDGTVVVSTGFHIRRLLGISPGGTVTDIAWDLGDPNGLAIDASGVIYLAETAHHRILRIRPASLLRPPPPSPP
jgi:hypothetical protein